MGNFRYSPIKVPVTPQEKKYLWWLEVLWWLFSLVLVAAIMLPIFRGMDTYPFVYMNVAFILLFFHYTRNVLLLKYSILKLSFWMKLSLALLTPALLFYMGGKFAYFQTFMDENTMGQLMPGLNFDRQNNLNNYIKNQMVFFATGTFIAGILFVLRMLISLWRQTNEKGI